LAGEIIRVVAASSPKLPSPRYVVFGGIK
jgi:hypothetical protein